MKPKYIIKLFKKTVKSHDKNSKYIVVALNKTKVNGKYFEKIGVIYTLSNLHIFLLNSRRLAHWLNKGVTIKSKVSWIVGSIYSSN